MFVRDVAANGDSVLFVGTKKQAGESIKEEAERAGAHYVNARWLAVCSPTSRPSVRESRDWSSCARCRRMAPLTVCPKKEVGKLELEIEKLEKYLGGIKT